MLEICENWLILVNSGIYYARQTREINQVLSYSVDFKVLSVCSFVWNKGLINIWNDHKIPK